MPCKNSHDPLPLTLQPRSQGFSLIWGRGFPTAPPPPEGEALGTKLPPLKKNIIIIIIIYYY